MQNKFCPECGQENLLSAKFCLACSNQFPDIQVKGTQPVKPATPKTNPKKIVRLEYDTDADPETMDLSEDGVDEGGSQFQKGDGAVLAESMINYIEQTQPMERSGGVRLGDIINTDNSGQGRKSLDKRRPAKGAFKKAKDILKDTENRPGAKKI